MNIFDIICSDFTFDESGYVYFGDEFPISSVHDLLFAKLEYFRLTKTIEISNGIEEDFTENHKIKLIFRNVSNFQYVNKGVLDVFTSMNFYYGKYRKTIEGYDIFLYLWESQFVKFSCESVEYLE